MNTQWPDLMASSEVRDAVAAATTAVERVHTAPANRRGWARSAAAASVRAARASAALDGAPIPLDPDAEVVADPVLAGALRVAAELPGLIPVWSRAPLQALARLHVLAAADLTGAEDQLGRPRPGVGPRLAGLAEIVRTGPWPPAVTTAVVVGELAVLRPFGSADGVVTRAAGRLTAASTGLDPRGLTVFEVGWLRTAARTDTLLTGYADGAVTPWLLGFAALLEAGAREGLSIAAAAG